MKHLILLLFIVPVIAVAQDFKFAKPDIAKLEAAKENYTSATDIYIYLMLNYKPLSGKIDVKYYEEANPSTICAFTQKFENSITYHESSCSESGLEILITIPKADLNQLELWIEKIHGGPNYNGMNNVWNKDGTLYYPEDEGAGCYYRIKQEKDKTVIDMYCGC